jgi:hypothetical protein
VRFLGSDFSVWDLPPDFVFDVGSLIPVLLRAARTSFLDPAQSRQRRSRFSCSRSLNRSARSCAGSAPARIDFRSRFEISRAVGFRFLMNRFFLSGAVRRLSLFSCRAANSVLLLSYRIKIFEFF